MCGRSRASAPSFPWSGAPPERAADGSLVPQDGGPFQLSAVESAVTDVAVSVLQARGEPAGAERLLGEVLIGLDRLGHLRRLVGTRTFAETEERAERAAAAVGLFGELPRPGDEAPTEVVALPAPPEVGNGSHSAADATPPDATLQDPAAMAPATRTASGPSWRDPRARIRDIAAETALPDVAGESSVLADEAMDAPTESLAEPAEAIDEPEQAIDELPEPADGPDNAVRARERAGSGADPVRLLLEIVLSELRRPDHPRLLELEPGRWWLRDRADIDAARAPLSDRLEWAVFSLLSTSGGLTEAAFIDRIGGMFKGHDTPDEELVRACLESYAQSEPDMSGLLRTEDSLQARYEEHGVLVGMLAEYGHRLGLRCWISRREQKRSFKGATNGALLSEAEQRVYLPLVSPGDPEVLESVDCLWYVRGKAAFLFEVEWTAMLGEPILKRGTRIPPNDQLVRFLVIPPERAELVRLKLARSPLLRQAMAEGNWHILKSDHLRRLYAREDASLDDLGPLLGLDPEIEQQGEQLALFA